MSTALIQHTFEGHQVRTQLDETGQPWFSAKDVCLVLGYSKYRDAISKLDEDEMRPVKMDTLGGKQSLIAINESGLYSLILRSNKPEARRFKKWVTSEVLPSIRKTGGYSRSSWIEARTEGKNVRKITTDIISSFIEYAKRQGSQSAEMYFMNFSKMVNAELLEIEGKKPANIRDQLNVMQLHQLSVAEQVISRTIVECMAQGRFYKDVYQDAKKKIQVYAATVGRSRVGASERQVVGLIA